MSELLLQELRDEKVNLNLGIKELKQKAYDMARNIEEAEKVFNDKVASKKTELEKKEKELINNTLMIEAMKKGTSEALDSSREKLKEAEHIKQVELNKLTEVNNKILDNTKILDKKTQLNKEILESIDKEKKELALSTEKYESSKNQAESKIKDLNSKIKFYNETKTEFDKIQLQISKGIDENKKEAERIKLLSNKFNDGIKNNEKLSKEYTVRFGELDKRELEINRQKKVQDDKSRSLEAQRIEQEIKEGRIQERSRLAGLKLKGIEVGEL